MKKRRRLLAFFVGLVAISAGVLGYQMVAERMTESRRRQERAKSAAYLARMEESPDPVIRALAAIAKVQLRKIHDDTEHGVNLPEDYVPIERRTIGGRALDIAYHGGWRLRGYFFAVFYDEDGRRVAVPIGENNSQKNAALEAVELLWSNRENRKSQPQRPHTDARPRRGIDRRR